ncbi:hypothetical protein H1C71_001352 [Ictidomys tridecemlineatus]|nr:hypothetical protein H1C71_001352 [Ictidomys tridecemlineatus]
MISPISYPKSPFLTVRKPRETWGFSFAKEDKCLLTAGWILKNGRGGGRGPTHVETLRGPEQRPQEGQSLALLLICTQSCWGKDRLVSGADNVSAKETTHYVSLGY